MSEQNTRLSMEEFLKMNSDYIEHKKTFEKKDTKNTILIVLAVFAIIAMSIWIGVATFNFLLAVIIMIILFIPFIYFAVSTEKKSKQKLEEYGVKLYQEYLKENGFIK